MLASPPPIIFTTNYTINFLSLRVGDVKIGIFRTRVKTLFHISIKRIVHDCLYYWMQTCTSQIFQ